MTARSTDLTLAGGFPPATRGQWRELVAGVLRKSGVLDEAASADDVERLITTATYDGIDIAPLYTRDDALPEPGLPGLAPFVRGARPDGRVSGGWDVRALHAHLVDSGNGRSDTGVAATNEAILADLEGGAGSLWLRLGDGALSPDALPDLLHEVGLDLISVGLETTGEDPWPGATTLIDLYAERGVAVSQARGNLGADPISYLARTGDDVGIDIASNLAEFASSRGFAHLRAITVDGLPYHEAGGSDAEELACALAAGVEYLRELTADGFTAERAAGQLEFRYAASADQFLTIAKLRAARRLWARVTELSGVAAPERAQRQHAVTSPAMLTRRDPWVNLLRGTVAAFAAGVGGADAVTVLPFDSAIGRSVGFARRIARNTQALLLDESSVARVIDPAGGSWYVEQLTDQLARTAWQWFQDIERAGGLVAALRSGLVAERLATTWAARSDAIARRADPLTGVSEFPDLDEAPVVREPVPAAGSAGPPADGLPRVRYAEGFEALRDRSDAVLAETGQRPAVFLATLGPLAVHTARSAFATNLFQAGGLQPVTPGALDSPEAAAAAFAASGTTVACLCSSDRTYREQAAATAAALKAAGATRVLLAGPPGDYSDVDGYVFLGCDALDALTTTYRTLGVSG